MINTISRRHFLRITAKVGMSVGITSCLPWGCSSGGDSPQSLFNHTPTTIRKFVTSLPGVGPSDASTFGQYLPLATKTTQTFAGQSTDVYNLAVGEFTGFMHPDLPKTTTFWGYYDLATNDKRYLAGVIVAKKGTPVLFNVTNQLPNKSIVPVDPTMMAGPDGMMVKDLPLNRHATHLHGGFTPWFSDGVPLQWYDPKGQTGASFMNVPGTNPAAGTATYYYPMQQSARFLWYHDHAMGITRTNAYSGIASALIIVDDFETNLVTQGLLPDLIGIPLVIQDKSFVPQNILDLDPTWQWGLPGDLWYPHAYVPNTLPGGIDNPYGKWDWGPAVSPPAQNTLPLPSPVSIIPEAFFDTIVINGGVYPYVNVPPRRVRFRILNGSQARFYHLNLYAEDSANPGEAKTSQPGPIMYQVGTEGGFLPAVAIHDNTTPIPLDLAADPSGDTALADGPFNLLLAPAERADVIIDFNGVPSGTSFILYNDAQAPFPGGDDRNEYATGFRDLPPSAEGRATLAGYGPNTRTLFKIVVTSGAGDSVATSAWLASMNTQLKNNFLTGNQPGLLFNNGDPSVPKFPFTGVPNRTLTLNEDFDNYGRLIQTIGTTGSQSLNNQGINTWGLPYLSSATENPAAGSTEVWQIFNLTGDTHPIHFHLVNVQIIQRQPFSGDPSSGLNFTGPAIPPDANEIGWKETVRMNPGEATTVIMKFALPVLPSPAMTNAVSPRTGGREYVWHCHILEHEEHDMMRPLIIT